MDLILDRDPSTEVCMTGNLFVAGMPDIFCHTLEDAKCESKVPGKTAIPAGRYEIKLRPFGESHLDARYRELFGDTYIGQLWLQDVPGFEFIYIHCGNDDGDTEGCILVGLTDEKGVDFIGHSREAYRKLYPLVAWTLGRGERCFIDIRDAK